MGGRLELKRALVTGGGRGIGAGIARAFAAEGAIVAVADLDRSAAAAVAADIEQRGGTAFAIAADVTMEAGVARMVTDAVASLEDIDILVNNAGFAGHAAVVDMTLAEWERVLYGNV